MRSSWETDTGHLARRWSEFGPLAQSTPEWMRSAGEMKAGYLQPIPDFASHSPFGGAYWFQPLPAHPESD
jgi:hypothetical protein